MRTVFISRDLPPQSAFRTALEAAGWKVHAQSLITVTPLPFTVPNEHFDWVFFSSSHGANLFLNSYDGPMDFKVGTVGRATAKVVESHGITPDFIGEGGDALKVGRELADTVKDAKVLFAGAEHGSGKVRSFLRPEQVLLLAVYRTASATDADIPDTDVVYLTSPSNARAYLGAHGSDGRAFVAIGTTTADFLKEHGVKEVLLPTSPQEKHVLEVLNGLR